jgi:hypothetical protein
MASCSPIRQNYRRHMAGILLSDMAPFSQNNYFLTLGRVAPWQTEASTTGSDALTIPETLDTDFTETEFWRDMVAAKRITQDNISLVIPRYDWKLGSVYEPYSSEIDLFNDISPAKFYVLVDETRVYKCIDNYYNASSKVAPTHTDSEIRKLSDGYRWKFMYSIPESKRKFLTKTIYDESVGTTSTQRITTQGFMPVEYVDYLRITDEERSLQWNVQETAVPGEISFIQLKEKYKPYLTIINCVKPDNSNSVQEDYENGYTGSVRIYSPYLVGSNGFYNNLIFSVDAGQGEGQRRLINSYSYTATGNYGTITLSSPLTVGLSANDSKFSITPNIRIVGDGVAKDTYLNNFQRADVTVKFGEGITISADTCSLQNIYNQSYVDSFELVDRGTNYTTADFLSVKGLTFVSGYVGDINDVADVIVSPPKGHGSNAVKEFGAAALMIVVDFTQTEKDKLSAITKYRQFGIVKNPELQNPQYKIRFEQSGSTGSFLVGETLVQATTGANGITGFDFARGRILSWDKGVSGYYGTSQIILDSVTGGNFFCDAFVSSTTGALNSGDFTVVDVSQRIVAGTEGSEVLRLKVIPAPGALGGSAGNEFRIDGSDFRPGLFVSSIGNKTSNISNTRFTAKINRWEPAAGVQSLGTLYLEDSSKIPTRLERLIECDYFLSPIRGASGASGIATIMDIGETTRNSTTVYDQTTAISVVTAISNPFNKGTFSTNTLVSGITGATTQGTGYVVDWTSVTGATQGTLRLYGVDGVFTGTRIAFTDANGTSANAIVTGISHEKELKYRSGELIYIQNVQPITRSIEQKEEIKVLFQF